MDKKTLSYGLKHGIAIPLKQKNISASSEALWDQAECRNFLKEKFSSMQTTKNSIGAMSFSLVDLDAQQITKDKSAITAINNLLKDLVILKPNRGNGIVLLDISDYRTSVK